jgi:hypothetical protein
MKHSKSNYFKLTNLAGLLVIMALWMPISTVDAQDRIFQFSIHNPDTDPNSELKVTLTAGSCYEGSMPDGQNYYIKGGQTLLLGDVARVQGNGCDGKQGYFTLTLSPNPREQSQVNFHFSNDGGMATYGANQYPGVLNPKVGNGYTYTSYEWPKASKVVGRWNLVCAGWCDKEIKEGFSLTNSSEQTNSSQVTNAVSVALKGGTDFVSVESNASYEKTLTDTFTRIVSGTNTSEITTRNILSPEQMKSLGIHSMWQWVGDSQYEGASYTIATTITTCTSSPSPPTYGPFDAEMVGKCTGGN